MFVLHCRRSCFCLLSSLFHPNDAAKAPHALRRIRETLKRKKWSGIKKRGSRKKKSSPIKNSNISSIMQGILKLLMTHISPSQLLPSLLFEHPLSTEILLCVPRKYLLFLFSPLYQRREQLSKYYFRSLSRLWCMCTALSLSATPCGECVWNWKIK